MVRAALLFCLVVLLPASAGAAPAAARWRLTYELHTSYSQGGPGGNPVVPELHAEPEKGQAGEFTYRLTCEVEFHLEPGSHPSNPDEILDRFTWSAEVGGLSSWVGITGEEVKTPAGQGGRAGGVLTGKDITAADLGLHVVMGEKDPRTGQTEVTVSIGPVARKVRDRMVLQYELQPVDVRIVRPEGVRAYTESYFRENRTFTAYLNLWGTTAKGFAKGNQVSAEGEDTVTFGTLRTLVTAGVPRDELTVRGEVLHRVAVPSQDGVASFAHQSGGKGAIPAAGQPTVEAWLVPPEPSGGPLASARARDGKFQLKAPLEKGKRLRLKTTWYSQEAQLEEHAVVEIECDEIRKAQRGASGSSWSVPVAATRQGKAWTRWKGQLREWDLGEEDRGATLRKDGSGLALEFRGNQALLVDTLILKAPYLNQNVLGPSVSVAVPRGRLLHNLPPWFTEAQKEEVRSRLPAGDRMDVRVLGDVVCFPTSTSMVLGCLGVAQVSEALVKETMQGVYDRYYETEGPRDGIWGWPFEFPFPNVAKSVEGLVGAGVPLEQAVQTVQQHFPEASFAKWPYRPKDETYRGNNVLWLATVPGTLRPWQIVSPVNDFVQPKYGVAAKFRGEFDVFAPTSAGAVLSALGRGQPGLVSIRHGPSADNGHILVLLGALVDHTGQPLRLIFHDPYGDQTRDPVGLGYYRGVSDVDERGEGWGTYVAYGPDINSHAGTMAGKYWCSYTPPAEKDLGPAQWQQALPARVRQRLLPSD